MYDYYCKNCNNIIGEWYNKYKYYYCSKYCKFTKLKNINSIYFLDCKKCNKFIGIICYHVCVNCFSKNQIIGEEKLKKWFLKYKKLIPNFLNYCKICNNKYNFRFQTWFFEELTFCKQ